MAAARAGLYIGILSGTSVDAIDCALVEISPQSFKLLATFTGNYPDELKTRIIRLCRGDKIHLRELGETDIEVGKLFAAAANQLMRQQQLLPEDIAGIGSHGQTVHHIPYGPHPFSMQIGDPNTIAEITGITTVADFRRRDMAAGGQGAPLAPLFHQYYFYTENKQGAVLNIGGIANLTLLAQEKSGQPRGFDTGPGNVLMDSWVRKHTGRQYDEAGQWASQGKVIPELLTGMLQEPYFAFKPPKSTGRELFNDDWLQNHLNRLDPATRESETFHEDVQRTLLELTAVSIYRACLDACTDTSTELPDFIAVCGGGSHNTVLMQRLQQLLPDCKICTTDELGMPSDWVEAATFAWLASRTLNREAIDCGQLTGSGRPVILGGIYSASKPKPPLAESKTLHTHQED